MNKEEFKIYAQTKANLGIHVIGSFWDGYNGRFNMTVYNNLYYLESWFREESATLEHYTLENICELIKFPVRHYE